MRVLLTGSAGFIGHYVGLALARRGDVVLGIDNLSPYYDVNLKKARLEAAGFMMTGDHPAASVDYPSYRWMQSDITDYPTLEKLFEENAFDAVCHLAAQPGVRYSLENPHSYVENNVVGFLNILEACRRFEVKNLVYASSSSVYGLNNSLPFSVDENVDHPVSVYAATKKSNELLAHAYSHLYGIATTGLRFFTVYGPWGRPDMAPMLFLRAALEGRSVRVFNNGDMMRDFTFVEDVAEGVLRVLDSPAKPDPQWPDHPRSSTSLAPYRVYNLGNSSPVKLLDFLSALEAASGRTIEKEMVAMQPGDVQATFADMSEFESHFGWRPKTPLKVGVERFVQWYFSFLRSSEGSL